MTPGQRAVRRFRRNKGAVAGAVITLIVLALAAVVPHFTADPDHQDIDHGLSELGAPLPPHDGAPLGTDSLGRDVLARIAAGASTSLEVAAVATLISLTIGVAIGLIAGFFGGVVDQILMRFVDLVLSFPFVLLAILLVSLLRQADLQNGIAPVFITLGVVGWTTMARVVRGKVLSLRELEYVTAARAVGATRGRILWRHLLPNVTGVVIVLTTLGFAQNILAESVLSYLGLGPPPPAATWGHMLADGQPYYRTAPWLIIVPGVAILITVVSFNLLGEGLRDALDPHGDR